MVDPQVRQKIPDKQILEAKGLADKGERGDSESNAEIGEEDEVLVLVLVQWAGWDKVVDATANAVFLANTLALRLAIVVIVSGNVGQDVHGPSNQLLTDEMDQARDWCLLGQLIQFVGSLSESCSIGFASLRNEDHVALHVTSGLVMFAVGDLP